MDEIAKELGEDKENIITIGDKNMPGCLLWMDDVVLIHHDKHIMQNMIDTTNEIANRYRIQFGQEKSKIMIVGKDKNDDKFKLGQMPLQKTDKYKYLGVTLNNKGNLSDHLNLIRSGLFQTVNDPGGGGGGGALKAPPYDLENYCVNLHHIIHAHFTRCFRQAPIKIFQKFAILTILQRFQNKKKRK